MNIENIEILKKWLIKNNVEETAIQSFWEYMNSYKIEHPEEFDRVFGSYNIEQLEVNIVSVSIKYANYPDFNYNHVVIDISVRNINKEVAYYRVLFNFDGSVDDDILFLD